MEAQETVSGEDPKDAAEGIAQLEALAEALLDFSDVEEVEAWLAQNNP